MADRESRKGKGLKGGSGRHFDREIIVLCVRWYLRYKLKRFRPAATTISGIELMHRIRKGQFNLIKLHREDTTAPSVWTAVLSAR